MKKTILFDLDGTLLPMDFHAFMKTYFTMMGYTFKDVLDPHVMIDYINQATEETVLTNNGRRNEEIFMEHFNTLIDEDVSEYIPRWSAFYDEGFMKCKDHTWQNQEIQEAVKILQDKGYTLAIATNPLLPLKSNIHRINWAGFDQSDFAYISSFEQNAYCKPFLEFYTEVTDALGVSPEDCYMIGNDVTEDLVARKLGMTTYLITDCKLNRKETKYETDHEGTYVEFLDFVKQLPDVNKTK